MQTGKLERRPIILFGSAFFDKVKSWLEMELLSQGYIDQSDLDLVQVTDSVEQALEHLFCCVPLATAVARKLSGSV